MTKIAIIEKIENQDVYATYLEDSSEGHAKAFFSMKEDLSFKINNPKNVFIKKGDSIELFIEPYGAVALSFSMFIMPLISFVIFYTLSGALINNIPEFLRISIGILGIASSFLATFIFFKKNPQKLPEIIRKIKSSELQSSCSTGCGSCSSCG